VPIEYSNLTIDRAGFIYSTISKSQTSLNEIRKLNYKGLNILRVDAFQSGIIPKNNYGDYPIYYNSMWQGIDTTFVDVCVDDNDLIYALDSTRGRVFVYDQDSNFLYNFGGLGTAKGLFSLVSAIDLVDGEVVVLDAKECTFTTFQITEFGKKINKAITLYNNGKYTEAEEPFREVLKLCSNYNIAYVGLGKSALRLKDYQSAMEYFKLGYNKAGYSEAFKLYSIQLLKDHIAITISLTLFLLMTPFLVGFGIDKFKKRRRNK
jgi:tetratricopeptide (TPR) repeat protein